MPTYGLSPVHPVTRNEILSFIRWETALARDRASRPHRLTSSQFNQVRYVINFARLTRFRPGTAGKATRPEGISRFEIDLTQELTVFRTRVHRVLGEAFSGGRIRYTQLLNATWRLWDDLLALRRQIILRHADEMSENELDAEVCRKTWVSVAGGGGGAGYVYIGAYKVMHEHGYVPGYIVGSSIGSIMGLFRARDREPDFDGMMQLAYDMRWDNLFRAISVKRRYGLPGLLRLFLRAGISSYFNLPDGRPMRLPDLGIPYEAVVAGLPKGALGETMEEFEHHLHPFTRQIPPWQFRAQIARQLLKLVAYMNPLLCKELLIGGDELTRDFDAVDAAGFSSAVPGILHYDVTRDDPVMHEILAELMRREGLAALVDGGVANNVACRTAFHRVMDGNIGTRNVFILGFDCFAPKWTQELYLQGIQRVIQLQVALNRPYAADIVEFPRTLSPLNLVPSRAQIDWAVAEGSRIMRKEMDWIRILMEPVEFRA